MTSKTYTRVVLAGVVSLFPLALIASPGSVNEKPGAVSDALIERFGGESVIDSVETKLVLGVPVYRVALHEGGRDLKVEVSATGDLLTIRSPGRLELLPESARNMLPDPLRKRGIQVSRLELLHPLAGESAPAVRHLVEAGGQSWLFDEEGRLLAEFPVSSPVIAPVIATQAADRSAISPTLRTADTPTTAPATTAASPMIRIADVRRGQAVVLRGEVRRIRDSDEFILADQSGSIEVYIGWQNEMPVTQGQTVTVHGRADDSSFPGFRPDIYASRIELPGGQVVELRRGGRGYEE